MPWGKHSLRKKTSYMPNKRRLQLYHATSSWLTSYYSKHLEINVWIKKERILLTFLGVTTASDWGVAQYRLLGEDRIKVGSQNKDLFWGRWHVRVRGHPRRGPSSRTCYQLREVARFVTEAKPTAGPDPTPEPNRTSEIEGRSMSHW